METERRSVEGIKGKANIFIFSSYDSIVDIIRQAQPSTDYDNKKVYALRRVGPGRVVICTQRTLPQYLVQVLYS